MIFALSNSMGSFEIVLGFSWWWLLVCVLLAFGLTYLLYGKNPFEAEKKALWRLLFALRFSALTLLFFLLLKPLLKSNTKEIEKPIVLLALDQSQSIVQSNDSSFIKNDFLKQWEELANKLNDFEVRFLSFGEKVREEDAHPFNDKASNLSDLLQTTQLRYENRNVAALVMASDGLYNQGSDPMFGLRNIQYPIFTVGLGDTTEKTDWLIKDLRANKIAFLGNQFPVRASVQAINMAGKSGLLQLFVNGIKFMEKSISINSNYLEIEEDFKIKADKAGIVQVKTVLQSINGEFTALNNTRSVFVEVIDSRSKIALLARAPHPDIAAIKAAINEKAGYTLDVFFTHQNQNPVVKNYDLIIAHELPAEAKDLVLFDEAEKAAIPVLFIASTQTNPVLMAKYTGSLQVKTGRIAENEAIAAFNPDFKLFALQPEELDVLNRMPPLVTMFGSYGTTGAANVLAYQQIGRVKTDDPLIAFHQHLNQKTGVIFGTGYWRWRMANYQWNQSHESVHSLLQKIIQYLIAKEDKRPFKVFLPKNTFYENERIRFEAELHNQSFELVNEPDVNLTVMSAEQQNFNYVLGRNSQGAYYLDIGFLAPGNYTYTAQTKRGTETVNAKGSFVVMPLLLEALQSKANHQLLLNMALASGGKHIKAKGINELPTLLNKDYDFKPVSYYKSTLEDFIHLKWLFVLAMLLLAIEWFIRKFNGIY
jgi:hypothetical protein